MRVTKLATRFFLLIEVFLVLLDQLLAFRTNFPQEYKCSQTSGRKHPISWGLGRCGEFSYLLVLHVSPIKIIPNCSGPLACFKDLSRPWEGTTIESREGGGWSCNIPFLLLHTSPIKIRPCCAGPLACFNYLSCPWRRLPSIPLRGDGVGVELLDSLHGASCFTIALQAL